MNKISVHFNNFPNFTHIYIRNKETGREINLDNIHITNSRIFGKNKQYYIMTCYDRNIEILFGFLYENKWAGFRYQKVKALHTSLHTFFLVYEPFCTGINVL